MDLSCARKHDHYIIDLNRRRLKTCCKAAYYDRSGEYERDLANILEDRADLKAGRRISSCENCWKLERQGYPSFRSIVPHAEEQIFSEREHLPFIVELWVESVCNLRCVYCSSEYSSKWRGEETRKGPSSLDAQTLSLIEKLWPSAGRINIVGGEPVLAPSTPAVLNLIQELLAKQPGDKRKTLFIVSNLATPQALFQEFLSALGRLSPHLDIDIAVSAEALGDQFEFIRDGSSFSIFEANLDALLARPGMQITLLSTLSVLSLGNYHRFLEFFLGKLNKSQRRANFAYNEVVHPAPLSPRGYPRPLAAEHGSVLTQLARFPRHLIQYEKFFDSFRSGLDALYSTAGSAPAVLEASRFLEAAAGGRLKPMNWRDHFPDIDMP